MQPKRSAFTLIELLTVIAIIGILAAIMIPVVGSVRESAHQAHCTSNIRESGVSLYIYLEENDFFLATHGSGTGSNELWPQQIVNSGVLEAREVLFCPTKDPGQEVDEMFFEGPWFWRTGYGLNMFDSELGSMRQVFGQSWTQFDMNYNAVRDPSSYILLAESLDQRDLPRFRIDSISAPGDGAIHLRHRGRANVFFLDGHVEAAGPTRLGALGMQSGYGETSQEIIEFPQR